MQKLVTTLALLAALAFPGGAAAAEQPFGRHVSECARMHLPAAQPPVVACDGHTFATFGEVVTHMRDHHG